MFWLSVRRTNDPDDDQGNLQGNEVFCLFALIFFKTRR